MAGDGIPIRTDDEETVLVVEDNPDVRTVAVAMLKQLGYGTTAVDTALAAFKLLESGCRFSLVFTDVVLPGETDGLVLARSVRARYPDIPIVLTTGYAKVIDSEFEFPFLRKPYHIALLERVMREALTATKANRTVLKS